VAAALAFFLATIATSVFWPIMATFLGMTTGTVNLVGTLGCWLVLFFITYVRVAAELLNLEIRI